MTTIYIIINKIDGKKYIGQTTNFELRIYNHLNNSNNRLLKRDVERQGRENFEVRILRKVADELADKAECDEIKKHNNLYPNGYNFTTGGKNCYTVNSISGLISRSKKAQSECVKILNIYNIPNEWLEAIKLSLHIPFSVYAKLAIEEKLQRDGCI